MLFKFGVTSSNSDKQTPFCYSQRTEHQRLAEKWRDFSISSYAVCKKTQNLLQEKTNMNSIKADKKYYPLVSMTFAHSSGLHRGTAVTFWDILGGL